jgi:hypothetical protein
MQGEELSRLCRLIISTVATWLAGQDDLTCAIHRVVVDTIQWACDAPPTVVIRTLIDEHPQIRADYDTWSVGARVHSFLGSEFTALSDLFTAFYEEFNLRFFGSRLPDYRVKVMHDIPVPQQPYTAETICKAEIRPDALLIQYNCWPEDMISRLVHLMAHIQTDCSHGPLWQEELSRLSGAGAPTDAEVKRLKTARWTPISASPWLPS